MLFLTPVELENLSILTIAELHDKEATMLDAEKEAFHNEIRCVEGLIGKFCKFWNDQEKMR